MRLRPGMLLFAQLWAASSCGERSRSGSAATLLADVSQSCDAVAERFRKTAATRVQVQADSFTAFTGPTKSFGCVVRAAGNLGGGVTVPYLTGSLADSLGTEWRRDSLMVANGPRGALYALRRGGVLCVFRIDWTLRVRYDVKGSPAPYSAEIGCAPTPERESVP